MINNFDFKNQFEIKIFKQKNVDFGISLESKEYLLY